LLKVYYRNRFRIRNCHTGKIERLNAITDKNGREMWVEGFDSLAEAEETLALYSSLRKGSYKIESYSDNQPFDLSISEGVSAVLEKEKYFSGKGLAESTFLRPSEERKYSPDKYYSPEVRFAQSVMFNKGISVHKTKKQKPAPFDDPVTEQKIKNLQDHAQMTIGYCVVDAIRRKLHQFSDKKSIGDYLRKRGYSARQQRKIIGQVFNPNI